MLAPCVNGCASHTPRRSTMFEAWGLDDTEGESPCGQGVPQFAVPKP
jgi:hypothetical protein